jgi:hypothetical protein
VGDIVIVRVQLITGDARTGRYIGHDDTHVWINDGRLRKIQHVMIADVIEAPKRKLEDPINCLENND